MNKLALIRLDPVEIVSTLPATTGRLTLPGEGHVVISPPQAGWEGFGFRIAAVAPAAPPAEGKVEVGRTVVLIDGEPVEVLTTEDAPPQPRRMIRKSLVQQRLIDAGLMDAAYAALTSQPVAFARWYSFDHQEVYADDPDALALLVAIGASAEAVMAPPEA